MSHESDPYPAGMATGGSSGGGSERPTQRMLGTIRQTRAVADRCEAFRTLRLSSVEGPVRRESVNRAEIGAKLAPRCVAILQPAIGLHAVKRDSTVAWTISEVSGPVIADGLSPGSIGEQAHVIQFLKPRRRSPDENVFSA